jgi:hypothetical protein
MKSSGRAAAVFLLILAAGGVRMTIERPFMKELRSQKLLSEPLPLGVGEKLGQTGAAVSLGGLRTLVATFLNLRAYTAFTEKRWRDVETTFDTIVDLAPGTSYYWATGSWHLAYNAGAWYKEDKELPALRRRELWTAYVTKGRNFLRRGIRNNPDNWQLNAELGDLLSSTDKLPALGDRDAALQEAARAYEAAAATGNAKLHVFRGAFYCLARIPGREREALAVGEKLFETRENRTPTVLALLIALSKHADPSLDTTALAGKLFSSDQLAYQALSGLWQGRDGYPVDGFAETLRVLEARLGIPPEKSVLRGG